MAIKQPCLCDIENIQELVVGSGCILQKH